MSQAVSAAKHLLGDGYLLLTSLESGEFSERLDRAALTYSLISILHDFGSAWWNSAETTFCIISYLSGVVYLLLSFSVADALAKNHHGKSIILAFLLTGGYLQLFAGYVENYPLYLPGTLLYILVGQRTLENRLSIYLPALLLGLLTALHLYFVVFAPSLLFLSWRNRQNFSSAWEHALVIFGALITAPLSFLFLLWVIGVDIHPYLGRTGGQHFLPIFSAPDKLYGLLSIAHLLDLINLLLLSAPGACMTIFLMRKEDLSHNIFLLTLAASSLTFLLVVNPNLGAFRDWDILALPALPLTVWAADAILSRIRDSDRRFHHASLICGAATLHSLLWMGLNSHDGSAKARYVDLMEKMSVSASGRPIPESRGVANGWANLAHLYHKEGNYEGAANTFGRAIEFDPTHFTFWHYKGLSYLKLGKYGDALEAYKRVVEVRPNWASGWVNVAGAELTLGRPEEAVVACKIALELDSNHKEALINLAIAYRTLGQMDEAHEIQLKLESLKE